MVVPLPAPVCGRPAVVWETPTDLTSYKALRGAANDLRMTANDYEALRTTTRHCERLRGAANDCEALRTTANGSELDANGLRTTPNCIRTTPELAAKCC